MRVLPNRAVHWMPVVDGKMSVNPEHHTETIGETGETRRRSVCKPAPAAKSTSHDMQTHRRDVLSPFRRERALQRLKMRRRSLAAAKATVPQATLVEKSGASRSSIKSQGRRRRHGSSDSGKRFQLPIRLTPEEPDAKTPSSSTENSDGSFQPASTIPDDSQSSILRYSADKTARDIKESTKSLATPVKYKPRLSARQRVLLDKASLHGTGASGSSARYC